MNRLDTSLEGGICYIIIERAFGVFISYSAIIILVLGMELGAAAINEHNSILFGVQILYTYRMVQVVQFFLRQLITMEALMISVERTNAMTSLPSEKELFTLYD